MILIIDDDTEIRDLLSKFLGEYGYKILAAPDGKNVLALLEKHKIDCVILDIMLPGEDGITVCKKIRQHYTTPIIMLTAVNEEVDRVISLELGADDYISKPFSPRELLARIKAVLRRADVNSRYLSKKITHKFSFSGWVLDHATQQLFSPDGVEVSITTGEYKLLHALVQNSQRVLSRDYLLDVLHNREGGPFDRSIDVQVSRLRQKLERDPKQPTTIKTVRGGGYMLTVAVEQC